MPLVQRHPGVDVDTFTMPDDFSQRRTVVSLPREPVPGDAWCIPDPPSRDRAGWPRYRTHRGWRMNPIGMSDAKVGFSRLLRRAAMGEDITIARSGRPVVEIVAVKPPGNEGSAPT